MPERYLSVREVAAILQVTPGQVCRYLRDGRLQAEPRLPVPGAPWLIKESVARAFRKRRRGHPYHCEKVVTTGRR